MDAKVTWKSGLSFTGRADSGFDIPLGTSVDHGGAGDGTSPMECVLIALGGCSAMDIISILEKKRQEVKSFEILLHGERAADHPKVFTDITIEYVVSGHAIDPDAVKRAVDLTESKYCSVMGMLKQTVNIQTKFTVNQI